MINIHHITKSYKAVQALSDVRFTVPDGEVTGFVGPNGAGKSTLMRIIMGLEAADSGEITIDGARGAKGPPAGASISALLDPSWVYGRRTAIDHLWMLAAAQGLPRRRAAEVLDMTGLGGVAKRPVGTFSLGMRQRLGIATTLLGDPRSILLDEPVNGLDPEGVWWVRQLARSLADRGVAVLISSHLLSELSQTADRIVVIASGRIVADGPLDDLLSSEGASTLAAADDTTRLAEACRRAGGAVTDAGHGRILIRGLEPVRVSATARSAGVLLTHLEAQTQSLEERFVALTSMHVDYRGDPPAATAQPRHLLPQETR